jgi:hypothetical protein
MSLKDPVRGSQAATFWGIREPFAAVVVTNIPMIFPLIKSWLSPCLRVGTRLKTSKTSPPFPAQSQLSVSVGGRNGHSRRRRHPFHPDDELNIFDEDEDDGTIVESEDSLGHVVGMHGTHALVRLPPHAKPNHGITVLQEVEVVTEGDAARDHALRRFPIDAHWGSSVAISTTSAAGPRSIRFVRQ